MKSYGKQILSKARSFNPKYIVGYVSSIDAFAAYLLDRNIELPGIHAVISAAEPVYDASRDLVRRAFGAPLFNAYGSREFMSLAAECEAQDGLHINSENALIETEYPDEHAASELLVTDLHNYATPFLRYRIGDLGMMQAPSACSCGRGLPKVAVVEGRVGDKLRTNDGQVVSSYMVSSRAQGIPGDQGISGAAGNRRRAHVKGSAECTASLRP